MRPLTYALYAFYAISPPEPGFQVLALREKVGAGVFAYGLHRPKAPPGAFTRITRFSRSSVLAQATFSRFLRRRPVNPTRAVLRGAWADV
jgi:hypothetical protein